MVYQVARCVHIPVIGIGGIRTAEDAIEFMIAGATAIQVGTATFVNPRAALDIIAGMEKWLADKGITDVNDIVGTVEIPGNGGGCREASMRSEGDR